MEKRAQEALFGVNPTLRNELTPFSTSQNVSLHFFVIAADVCAVKKYFAYVNSITRAFGQK